MWQKIGYFEIILAASGLIFLITVMFVILYFYYNKNIVLKQLEQNKTKLIHQKELLKNELLAIEKERKRIAQDLHDEVGANLAYIGLNLEQIANEYSEHSEMTSKIQNCHEQLNQSIGVVRRISHDLLPPTLEMFGLVPAIKEYLDHIDSSLTISFDTDDNFPQIDQNISLQLYRVLLELIGNAIKHSQGDHIAISMLYLNEKPVIKVSDNGVGYDFMEMQTKKGLGLKNIISRLETVNANFKTHNPDLGSEIEIIINQ